MPSSGWPPCSCPDDGALAAAWRDAKPARTRYPRLPPADSPKDESQTRSPRLMYPAYRRPSARVPHCTPRSYGESALWRRRQWHSVGIRYPLYRPLEAGRDAPATLFCFNVFQNDPAALDGDRRQVRQESRARVRVRVCVHEGALPLMVTGLITGCSFRYNPDAPPFRPREKLRC